MIFHKVLFDIRIGIDCGTDSLPLFRDSNRLTTKFRKALVSNI